jgi:hypothetical protein
MPDKDSTVNNTSMPSIPSTGPTNQYRKDLEATALSTSHVDYVLAAEFNIDKGSSLTWEHPCATGTKREYVPLYYLVGEPSIFDTCLLILFLNLFVNVPMGLEL